MIAKHIESKRDHDIEKLGNYLNDASHKGEKCLLTWKDGFDNDDISWDMSIKQMKLTQDANTRCKSNKNYHLVISFCQKDENKLTKEVFQDIEKMLAKTLHLHEHQRLCAVHKNTSNVHMHVAYNLIHPEKHTLESRGVFHEYDRLGEVCRQIEKKYGFVPLQVKKSEKKNSKISTNATDLEVRHGEKSFQRYALEHKAEIINGIQKASNWQEAHHALERCGVVLQTKGNGLVLCSATGDGAIKCSQIDRNLSRSKLEARFGAFQKSALPVSVHRPENDPEQDREKPQIVSELQKASSWKELHSILAEHHLAIVPKKNGLVLRDATTQEEVMKASRLDRSLSKKKLEERLGAFQPRAAMPDATVREEALRQAPVDSGENLFEFERERELPGAVIETPAPAQAEPVQVEQQADSFEDEDAWIEELAQLHLQYLQRLKDAKKKADSQSSQEDHLKMSMKNSISWEELHKNLENYGLSIQKNTDTLIISGKEDDNISFECTQKTNLLLKKKFGEFQEKENKNHSYKKEPLHPENELRDKLYKEFQEQFKERKRLIDEEYKKTKEVWAWMKNTYDNAKKTTRYKRYLVGHYFDAIEKEKKEHKKVISGIKSKYKATWVEFLQKKAIDGDLDALAVLRLQTNQKSAKSIYFVRATSKTYLHVPYNDREKVRDLGAKWDKSKKAWYIDQGKNVYNFQKWMSNESREKIKESVRNNIIQNKKNIEKSAPGQRLLNIIQKENQDIASGKAKKSHFQGCDYDVDLQGIVIIKLKNGGSIRDTGKQIYFSKEKETKKAAQLYAQVKFGSRTTTSQNVIEKSPLLPKSKKNGKWKKWREAIAKDLNYLRGFARNGLRRLSKLTVDACWQEKRKQEMFLPTHAQRDMGRESGR